MFARKATLLLVTILITIFLLAPPLSIDAADHLDGGKDISTQATPFADISDFWVFLDPNDNDRLELIMAVNPFIIPSENESRGLFDPAVVYRFNIENTGDAKPDKFLDITFSKQIGRDTPQTATVKLPSGKTFTAPTTIALGEPVAPPARVNTVNSASGSKFFAGIADDPFFFDVPAEVQFRRGLLVGTRDPNFFSRGRDTFAGFNVMTIVLSIPLSEVKGSAGNMVGISASTLIPKKAIRNTDGTVSYKGSLIQVDSAGIPVVNVVLLDFNLKDRYNIIGPDVSALSQNVIGSLRSIGTDDTSIGLLKALIVDKGDYIRIDLSKPNTGPEGGTNPDAAFPNGRRLVDDVTDIVISLINNRVPLPDGIDANDKKFLNVFPWVPQPNMPLKKGEQDTTQN
ncbi:MAG: DUF4331 family protein [Acidobacteria bacterium]|nr:DUF4331 family protein [Acidobacteriota bacterium]